MIDFHATMAKLVAESICFEFDHRYTGHLECPACAEPAGEPIVVRPLYWVMKEKDAAV